MRCHHVRRAAVHALPSLVFALCFVRGAYSQPQSFSSGSTGADGALNITAPGVTYFNPTTLSLHPAIPNIYNFTTITIAAGATLKFTEKVFHGPVYFLATGNVDIEGTLDLGGENTVGGTNFQGDRAPSYAGSGGYGGGLGGKQQQFGGPPPEPGNGPGGGAAGNATTGNGFGTGGGFSGSPYLIPLIGGSGGGGGAGTISTSFGPSGGAGGGAILIASSATITVNGSINASGGERASTGGTLGGGGSGGAIRLVANTINGSGSLLADGSVLNNGNSASSGGLVRLETFQNGFSGTIGNISSSVLRSIPFSLVLPTTPPATLTVTAINGVTINANPFIFPDITINTSSPVVVNIQAQYVPPGTIPNLIVSSSTGPDQVIPCTPLQGTLQQSTSTATVTFPVGGSRGFVKATWH